MKIPKYQLILGLFVLFVIALALTWVAVKWNSGEDEGRAPVPGWSIASENGLSFQYPPNFGTQYIQALDWPPKLQVVPGSFSCLDAGEPIERAGRTESRTIGGRRFCVTELVQGAAGSIYTQYAYAFENEDKTAILTFSTRAPQCGNYPEPQMSECQAERDNFKLDDLVGRIAGTVR